MSYRSVCKEKVVKRVPRIYNSTRKKDQERDQEEWEK